MTAVPMAGFPGQVQAVVQRFRHVTRLHWQARVPSTNSVALDLARSGAPHGTFVLADRQEAGRGRHGRGWSSPPGVGLWMSWILRPPLPPDRAYLVTWAAAVAVAEAAARTAGLYAEIKWPNDVLVRGRKICGLLAEVASGGDALDFIVLGVGLNVNQAEADFPEAFRDRAASLRSASGHAVDRVLTLAAFLEAFEFEYDRLLRDGGEAVRRAWTERSCVIGRPITLRTGGGEFAARAVGVDPDGALLVERDGTVEAIHSAEVELLRLGEA